MKSTESTQKWPTRIWRQISGSLKRLLIWVLVLATWEAAYRATAFNRLSNPHGWKPWVFPAPSQIVDALFDLLNIQTGFGEPLHHGWPMPEDIQSHRSHSFFQSELVQADLVSGGRLLIGFSISITLGATLGMTMWRFRPVDDFLGPLFLGMQTLPSVCWVPLGIIAFGLSEAAIEFVLVMGSFFAVAISLRDGLRTIPPLYQRAGRMLGAGGWRVYRYVLIPAAMPSLASGLRQGFSFAWRSLMGAEFVFLYSRRHGLGYLLQSAREDNNPAEVMGIMVVMVVIGMLADRLVFAPLERRISRRFGLIAAT
jgi:NitT/TauT family transport system permease protein